MKDTRKEALEALDDLVDRAHKRELRMAPEVREIDLICNHHRTIRRELKAPSVPEGWTIYSDPDSDYIAVQHKDGSGFLAGHGSPENIASTILHRLAEDMLAAASDQTPTMALHGGESEPGYAALTFIGKFIRDDGEEWQYKEFPATERLESWAEGHSVYVEGYNQALAAPEPGDDD